ncbi:class I fructose-bisphosphate aldolase [Pararhizobium sp. IMCC21322]|uniref:class I fructose-bisphosphate aldolase n=1 Tax=Pararhizobium sp. IMCC21322 TaxID=3067903 RepID=UPI002740EA43|nr:aldolase [Pararhizobium sp. IMCC21322]
MTKHRLNRFLGADGKCFDVAIDHGFFNEPGFLSGIEDMRDAVATVAQAQPDAVQLSPGMARHLQAIPGKDKPSLVLRTDVANIYAKDLPQYLFSQIVENAVEQAVQLDAACLCVNLLLMPNQPEVHAQCVSNIARLKPEADAAGMPLMVEPLVMQDNAKAGGYMVNGDLALIRTLVRQAVEMGADVIKADPTDDVAEYHKVVEAASGIPILVRGGGRVSDAEILQRTTDLMEQGAMGIVYGRNVIQHDHPAAITKALMAIVHEGMSPEDALAMMQDLSS